MALSLEIKETIIGKNTLEHYNKWMSQAPEDREDIGLAISYDMGCNKCSSGHQYNSLSGHAFIIGCFTRRIIGCVIFSKKCAICTKRNHKTDDKTNEGIVLDLSIPFDICNMNGSSSESEDEDSP